MADERHQITATIGPYCGTVLTLPAAEADQAVADQWAVEQTAAPYDMAVPPAGYPELTPVEREAAEAAARAWYDAQQPTGQ